LTGIDLPQIPSDAPEADKPALRQARYEKELAVAETTQVTRADAAVALNEARKDKELEVENARADSELALENARGDKRLEVQNARADTELALNEARDDKELEVENARADKAREVMEARVDADRTAEVALLKSIHDAYIDVTKGTLDRSVTRAQFLTAAIGAVSTAYTTLLGVNFAVASSKPAPGRALIPVVFLGVALALAALYVAFLRRTSSDRQLLPTSTAVTVAEDRLVTFMEWTFAGVLARSWALRTSIVAFAAGIAVMPLPFVTISDKTEHWVVAVAAASVVGWLICEGVGAFRHRNTAYVDDPPALTDQ
jgi:hypothetical protein